MSDGPVREELLAQAMRWLARREYSVHELTGRLAAKGYPTKEVTGALEDLKAQGLVSDARFAESLLRSRIERGYGPVKIALELRTKGVDDALVEDLLDREEERWLERLEAVWRKRFGTPPADYREWARQARGLQSRGFTADQVRRVIPDIES